MKRFLMVLLTACAISFSGCVSQPTYPFGLKKAQWESLSQSQRDWYQAHQKEGNQSSPEITPDRNLEKLTAFGAQEARAAEWHPPEPVD
jgi:hypothetical protein